MQFYLCIIKYNSGIEVGLRHDDKKLYVDFIKNELAVNLCSLEKSAFKELKLDDEGFLYNLTLSIITDFLLNVKSDRKNEAQD